MSVTRVWSCSTQGGIGCLHLTLQKKQSVNFLQPSSINSPAQHFPPCTGALSHRAPLCLALCWRAEDAAGFLPRPLDFPFSIFHPCQPYSLSIHQVAKFLLLRPAGYKINVESQGVFLTLSRNSFSSKFFRPSLFLIIDLSGPMPPLNQNASFLALKSSEQSTRCGLLAARWRLNTWFQRKVKYARKVEKMYLGTRYQVPGGGNR